VKDPSEMTVEELQDFLRKYEEKKRAKKAGGYWSGERETLRERLARDPKAYLAKRKDYEYLRRWLTDEEIAQLPLLNE